MALAFAGLGEVMRIFSLLAVAMLLVSCSDGAVTTRPNVIAGQLAPYTTDADLPNYLASDLDLGRMEKILGIGEGQTTPLERSQFETKEEFEARVSKLLSEWSAPNGGKGLFVFSVQAHQAYDIDTKTASFCVLDTLMHECLLPSSNTPSGAVLSFSSFALPSIGVTRKLMLAFDKQDEPPVPLKLGIEPKTAEQIADSAKLAFVFSIPQPVAEGGPVSTKSTRSGREVYSVDSIKVKLHRVVAYQSDGQVIGAKSYD